MSNLQDGKIYVKNNRKNSCRIRNRIRILNQLKSRIRIREKKHSGSTTLAVRAKKSYLGWQNLRDGSLVVWQVFTAGHQGGGGRIRGRRRSIILFHAQRYVTAAAGRRQNGPGRRPVHPVHIAAAGTGCGIHGAGRAGLGQLRHREVGSGIHPAYRMINDGLAG
jgi:hypothetical protein